MEICGDTEELELFESKTLIDYLEFKWSSYSSKIHKVGLTSHIIYLITFSLYVNECYVY